MVTEHPLNTRRNTASALSTPSQGLSTLSVAYRIAPNTVAQAIGLGLLIALLVMLSHLNHPAFATKSLDFTNQGQSQTLTPQGKTINSSNTDTEPQEVQRPKPTKRPTPKPHPKMAHGGVAGLQPTSSMRAMAPRVTEVPAFGQRTAPGHVSRVDHAPRMVKMPSRHDRYAQSLGQAREEAGIIHPRAQQTSNATVVTGTAGNIGTMAPSSPDSATASAAPPDSSSRNDGSWRYNRFERPIQAGPSNQRATQAAPAVKRPLPTYHGGAQPIAFTIVTTGERHTLPQGQTAPGQPEIKSVQISQHIYDKLQDIRQLTSDNKYEEATVALHQLLLENDGHAVLWASLGELYIATEKWPEAASAYKEAAALWPKRYTRRWGELLVQTGELDRALTVLEPLSKAEPNDANLLYTLGTVYLEQKQPRLAVARLGQAIRLGMEADSVYMNLALAYEELGDMRHARHYFQKALEMNPNASDAGAALQRLQVSSAQIQ